MVTRREENDVAGTRDAEGLDEGRVWSVTAAICVACSRRGVDVPEALEHLVHRRGWGTVGWRQGVGAGIVLSARRPHRRRGCGIPPAARDEGED